MGRVIARAMEKLGYSLLLLDKDEDLLKNCPDEHKFQIKKEHLVGL